MSGEYVYYSEGFFGFGPPGAFHLWSPMHLIPNLICVGLILLAWLKREWFRNWKDELHFRFVLSFLMFFCEYSFFIWLLYVGDTTGEYLMIAKLPLHLCDIGIISCMFMVPSKNRTLFGFNFFATLSGATIACIVPQMAMGNADPSYFRYYQFFGEHLIPIFCTFYMMFVHGMKPRYYDIWVTMGVLFLLFIPSVMLNRAFPGSDYLYMNTDISFFPEALAPRATVYGVIALSLFHLMWFVWKLLHHWQSRRNTRTDCTSKNHI